MGQSISKERFLKAYEKNPLNVSKVCIQTKIHRSTVYNWLQDDKAFKKDYDAVRMALIDECEECVFTNTRRDPNLALKVLERLNPEVYSLKVREESCFSAKDHIGTDFLPSITFTVLPKSEE